MKEGKNVMNWFNYELAEKSHLKIWNGIKDEPDCH